MSIMLHELFKLLKSARCSDVTIIRVGTCGGIGVEAGTVVVSSGAFSAGLEPVYVTSALGKVLKLPALANEDVTEEIAACSRAGDKFRVAVGKTYCADDFYQGQGRLDGSFCNYQKEDQIDFLKTLYNLGVKNIEMESAGVLAMSHRVGLKAAVVCVVLVDRLKSDLPTVTSEMLGDFQNYPIELVSRYIWSKLKKM